MDSKTSIGWLLKMSTDTCTDFKIEKKNSLFRHLSVGCSKGQCSKVSTFHKPAGWARNLQRKACGILFFNMCLLVKGSRVITLLSLFILFFKKCFIFSFCKPCPLYSNHLNLLLYYYYYNHKSCLSHFFFLMDLKHFTTAT